MNGDCECCWEPHWSPDGPSSNVAGAAFESRPLLESGSRLMLVKRLSRGQATVPGKLGLARTYLET